ncbi:helix-turn-helix transcriptional regulator [Jonesia quinghaiensis]|uniref:helix-turn-helix transcriptional regulator n=1 Tax=Jonesia quinghaiensis TaxID=262806 RepID=UPI00146D18E8|nr:WYL domain-containing protein [Jonesia quinghaiensis]
MTRREIQEKVAGYPRDARPSAFERMFERDKEMLRDLGIPLITEDAAHPEDVGYRIDHASYSLGDVRLTPEEFSLVTIATSLWRETSVESLSHRALTKLRTGYHGQEDLQLLTGVVPSLRDVSGAYEPVVTALAGGRSLRFTYRSAHSGSLRLRTVDPWRLVLRDGNWYLVGRDVDVDQPRVFKLSRIAGRVQVLGPPGSVDIPEVCDVDALMGAARGPSSVAVVGVRPGSAPRLVARSTRVDQPVVDGFLTFECLWHGEAQLVEELAAYGDGVVVLSPPVLRDAVIAKLVGVTRVVGSQEGERRG